MYKRKRNLQYFFLVICMALSMGQHAVIASTNPDTTETSSNSTPPNDTTKSQSSDDDHQKLLNIVQGGGFLRKVRSFFKKMLGNTGETHGQSIWGYIILLLVILGYILGRRMGLVNQVILALGMVFFIPMIEWIKPPVENFIRDQLSLEEISIWVSVIISFILLSIFCFIQTLLHKILSFLLTITLLSPFNKFLGGIVGMITTGLMLGTAIILLGEVDIHISNDVLLCKELRFLADKVWGEDVIVSWMK